MEYALYDNINDDIHYDDYVRLYCKPTFEDITAADSVESRSVSENGLMFYTP